MVFCGSSSHQAPRLVNGAVRRSCEQLGMTINSLYADDLSERTYRFYFWSHELGEPPHVHVDRERFSAKFWFEPVQLARNLGFRAHELREIQSIIEKHKGDLLEAWHGHFGTGLG